MTRKRTLIALVVLAALSTESATAASLPILGTSPEAGMIPDARGFGHVRPRLIFLGGDPSGVVCRIHWLTWGQRFAIGTGVALDAIHGVSNGRWAPVVVTLSRLGTQHGRPAYRRLDWAFPDGEVNPESPGCRL